MYIIFVLLILNMWQVRSFKEDQLRYPRVRDAYKNKEETVDLLLENHSLDKDNLKIFIRVLKDSEFVEVWGSKIDEFVYKKIIEYPFCSSSGSLGPKREQGDGQIPEGFYYIDRFNPASNFHLSLGINYPNQSDRILGKKNSPGGDIFIHGNCVTIGCIPITDDKIKELYIMAIEAKNNGQEKIPVHIFPGSLDLDNLLNLSEEYHHFGYNEFWENLSSGYRYFEVNHKMPDIKINDKGQYYLN